jgi:hypothetical protein
VGSTTAQTGAAYTRGMSAGIRRRAAGRWPLGRAVVIAVVLLAGCAPTPDGVDPAPSGSGEGSRSSMSAEAVSGVAVGDLVCEKADLPTRDTCRHRDTAELAAGLEPEFVLALGDLQYDAGALEEFEASWKPTWGRFDPILLPVPGNHEYLTAGAAGFRSYFGTPPYSVRQVGAWRVYLLDSDCEDVDCDRQAAWLTDELAGATTPCTAIAMHHPRVSSGYHGDTEMVQPLWRAAVEGGVDIALTGHDHDYERFGRLDVDGTPVDDPSTRGTREFVVGTGGRSLRPLAPRRPGSEYAQDRQFGVLDLTLDDGGYAWRFVGLDGTVMDAGRDTCRT